jgi:vancomycin resistance protein YoaR
MKYLDKGIVAKTLIISSVSLLIFTPFLYFIFSERILPNTYVNNINIGGLTKEEAQSKLLHKVRVPEEITILIQNQEIKVKPNDFELKYDFEKTVKTAYEKKKEGLFSNLKSIYQQSFITPVFYYNSEKLGNIIEEILSQIKGKGQKPQARLENDKIKITNGTIGIIVEKENLENQIKDRIKSLNFSPIVINAISDKYVLNDSSLKEYEKRVSKLLGKKLTVSFENFQEEIKDEEIISLTDFFDDYQKDKVKELSSLISKKIERPPQNPIFNFENGVVKEFKPAEDGIVVNQEDFVANLISSFEILENSDQKTITITPPVKRTPPDYETEDVNSLGIKELVGSGKSKFVGSIPSRIHNIKLAASKFNGILVKPEEIFSFNQILGEVSKETGYEQAYIIKEGQTVLGDGGGVCQVSTTLFRAALNAGLPILERQAHAYRVGYYEQDSPPGFDATIFTPSPDLKFKNDTPGHLLIQTKFDGNNKTLVFEIYGTKDNRQVYISKPIITNITPPPEDLYIDDPNLPSGQIKQIDWKAWGAKVWFDYKVTKEGQEIFSKRFYSNYKPWQAKFLRGTKQTQ